MLSTLFEMVSGMDPVWLAVGVLLLIYAAIMTERLNRAIVALLGAVIVIASGILTQEQAVEGIDFNTIGLLTGMMVIVLDFQEKRDFRIPRDLGREKGQRQPRGDSRDSCGGDRGGFLPLG